MTYKKQRTKIKFVFESAMLQKNFYIRNAHSSIQKLNRLFPIVPPFIVAHIFQNRTSFLEAINKKKLTTKKIVSQILLHEMTHLYTNALNPNLPDWLKEGISVYVAEQIFRSSISTTDWKKIAQKDIPFGRISWEFAAEHNGYNIAGLLIMFFVRRYGWAKFITAISYRQSMHFSIKNFSLYFDEKFEWFIADFKKQFIK